MHFNYIKKGFAGILFILSHNICQAQKPHLDSAAIADWPIVGEDPLISSNGKYIGYFIEYQNKLKWGKDFVIQSIASGKEAVYSGIDRAQFTRDNQFCIGLNNSSGQLMITHLQDQQNEKIDDVVSYKLIERNKSERIIYTKKGNEQDAIVLNPSSGKSVTLEGVRSMESLGESVILAIKNEAGENQMVIYNPFTENKQVIWNGNSSVNSLVVQDKGTIIAFLADHKIWLYNPKLSSTAQPVNLPPSPKLDTLTLSSLTGISNSGNLLFLQYGGPAYPDTLPGQNPVRIFDYRDANFDLDNKFIQKQYHVIYNLRKEMLSFPEDDNWTFLSTFNTSRFITKDDQYFVRRNRNFGGEYYWNKKQEGTISLFSLADNKEVVKLAGFECISPDSKYIIYPNSTYFGDYYSFNIQANTKTDLTGNLPIPAIDNAEENLQGSNNRGFGQLIWIKNSDCFILSDRYDLWLIDASGKQLAVNLTNGYGRAHHISFRWPANADSITLTKGEPVTLSLYNEDTKESGFAEINWNKPSVPKILTMDHYLYGNYPHECRVIKAAGVNRWLVRRQSPYESPNYFLTSDFKNFTPVSHNYPEKKYSWFSSKVINYRTKNGVSSQAILYIPDHLEPGKKYPVLFNFYEHETDRAGSNYQMPEYTSMYYFNYTKMLSEGYLVCVCDIHFTLGETARNITDCVEGAADAIAGLPYVDSSHYGASGGSFGGYGVNCLAALSHKFKAIVSVSGLTDLLNAYSNVPGLRDEEVENRQLRMGVSLGTAPDLYLENSPVTYTRKVTTPLLIVDNPHDGNVNPQQGIDWFINLRREGRKAWMLWYPDEGHGVFKRNNQIDFSIRMDQFFDHYLKGAPMPKWMSEDIPSWQRSSRDNFSLLQEAAEPGAGLNTKQDIERQQKYIQNNRKF